MARSTSGESVMERVVRILETFGPEVTAQSLTELSRRARLPLSTTGRLADEMVSHGLMQRGDDRLFRVGLRLWELAARAAPTLSLREAALPFMEDLHAVIGHHVQLGVLGEREVLFVERLSSPGAVLNVTRIAGRLPLHASSSGLVLLAFAPRDTQDALLQGPLKGYTSATITSGDTLRSVLGDVRRTGFAFLPGAINVEATGIAVPLRDDDAHVVAALSVIVPKDETAFSRIPVLQAAARGISRALSGR